MDNGNDAAAAAAKIDAAAVEVLSKAPGAWAASQTPPEKPKAGGWQLVTLSKPRRVLADVPDEVVKFEPNDNGDKVLVFDGKRCPRGVIEYFGEPCFLDGQPAGSSK